MELKSIKSLTGPLSLATILACGVNMAWIIACALVEALCEPWLPTGLKGELARALGIAILLPSPATFGWIEFFIQPIDRMRSNQAFGIDYFTALGYTLPADVVPMLLLMMLSAGLAFWCYRRQRRYSEHGAAAWAALVFLLGVPGLIGYLLHRRWPFSEKCAQCAAVTPRDREACLHCGAVFPAPALTGIEVFD